jgi:hypothetical protein
MEGMDPGEECYNEELDMQEFYAAEEEIDLECPETSDSEWYSTDEEDEEEEDKEIYAGKRTREGGRSNEKETRASQAQDVKRTNYHLRSGILSMYFILLPKKRSVNGRKLVSIIENYSKNRME